ncbi:MAG TPA: hypothetical protein GX401_09840 [Clostridiales bacterium]|nr:hypothetical protein [Clostridiales bacterium]
MKEFDVTITETLKKTVTVEAENREEAEQLVSDRWHNSEYILDAEDFQGAEFSCAHSRPHRSRFEKESER